MCLVLLFLISFACFSQPMEAAGIGTGVVKVRTSANVRSGAGLSNSVIASLYNGNRVDVLKKSGSWYNIKMPNGRKGWIYYTLLNVTNNGTSSRAQGASNGTVTGSVVRVRSNAGTNSSIISRVRKGTKVEVLGKKATNDRYGLWYRIKAPNGLIGWLCGDYLNVNGSVPAQKSGSSQGGQSSGTGYVTASVLNIRSVPSTRGNAPIGKLTRGTKVNIVGQGNGWYKIQWGSKQGWVSANYITKKSPSSNSNGSSKKKVQSAEGYVNTRAGLNLRKLPVISGGTLVTALPYKTSVKIKAQKGDWYQVETSGGKTGWVFSKYITKGTASSRGGSTGKVSDVISTARNYLGYRYAYGGASPSSGFDCSGLTQYVYKKFGVNLPRSSSAQGAYKATKISSMGALKPGDLVCFTTNGSGNVSHVGIYTGNGNFIHAPNSKRRVEEVNMHTKFSGYYAKRFKWGLRVLK